METYLNISAGLGINFDINGGRSGEAGIEYLQFINREFPGKPISGITKGYASWYRMHYKYKNLFIGAAYWKAHDFFAPNGNSIYGSVISNSSDYVVHEREVITGTLYFNPFPESDLGLFLGVETYYDVPIKNLDYAITLHLRFDKLIRLAILKR